MSYVRIASLALLAAVASAAVTPQSNFLPVKFTVNSAPYDIIATPITPDAPYSQAAYQCNVTGDSRFPPYASGTFPLSLAVPVGQRVRVIFANGNLNGATVTQQGEPGVIVQQGGSPIVQQVGGASPIVQKVGSPIVQQNTASPAVLVVQQTPTVVQQSYPQAPSIPNPPPVPSTPATPAAPKSPPPPTSGSPPPPATRSPPPPATTPTTPPASPPIVGSPPPPTVTPPASPPLVGSPPPTNPSPATPPTADSTPTTASPPPASASSPPSTEEPKPTPAATAGAVTPTASSGGRKLLQDTVPGGPNNGLVEYVALASANTVPGFFAGSTQFGVPYIEFTASEAARGQTASFRGALEVAKVVGGVPIYPFSPNPSLSPECQVNVDFTVA